MTLHATGDRAAEDDVYYAYRLILEREPDPSGLAAHCRQVAEGISVDRLVRGFVNSDEYRLRQTDEMRPTPVELGGYHVLVQLRDTDLARAVFNTHQYEEHVRAAVRESLQEGDVALDVGANVGVITLLAASIVGNSGRVIAVEPNPDNLQLLYRGIVYNRFTNIEVLPYAASNQRNFFSLTGGRSNTHLIRARAPEEGGFFVQSVVLDELLGDLVRVNFVKMDIEGHEPQAMAGFARVIEKHRPVFLVEFNPRCLHIQQNDPLAFLQQIFASYPRVRVLTALGDDETLDSAEKVMSYWQRRAREVRAENLLPEGLLHFDLLTLI